ncbi:hypothetical protein ABES03_09420 [Neobacillus rhizosphaerae]|uniref:hypothetical protein n=1 Tax=Neobacillus rhizosphaerae TaxID=2880965 RepID=UPI003D273560
MPDKKEVEKESLEEKTLNKVMQTNLVEEEQLVENEDMEQLSSLDVLWQHAFGEIDEWAKHAEFRDEIFLKEAKHFAESIKRNRGNVKDIAERFNKEFAEWERTAREEFLMSTTSLQHFFPIRSYEDINAQIDQIQQKTMSILSAPCQTLNNYLTMEKYLEMIDQYIALRKKGRMQYIKTVKQAGNIIYESQRGFVNLFARQIKSVMFPLNKYLEKTEELSKS